MQKLKDNLKNGGRLHHFCVVVGNSEQALKDLEDLFKKFFNFPFTANSNFSLERFENFFVEDAERFSGQNLRKIKENHIRLSVLVCQNITRQAQNALLKTFEEPVLGHYFFMLIPTANLLLPTVASRADIIYLETPSSIYESADSADEFFKNYQEISRMSYGERLALATKILERLRKDKIHKSDVVSYINDLAYEHNKQSLFSQPIEDARLKSLENLHVITKYADKQGASLKSLLEYLMLSIREFDTIKK